MGPRDGITLIAPHCELQLDAGGELDRVPRIKWIQVATEGEYRGHHQGAFALTRKVFDSFVRNFRADPRYTPGRVEVEGRTIMAGSKPVIRYDFEHASEQAPSASVAVAGIPAPAWALDLEVRNGPKGAELWALTKLGERIRSYIAHDEYRQTSIAFTLDGIDYRTKERVGPLITSIAFTNDPFLKHLESFAASRRASSPAAHEVQQSQSGEGATGLPGDPAMANPDSATADEIKALRQFRLAVCSAAKIRTLATDEEVLAAVGEQAAAAPAASGLLDALGVGSLDDAKASIAKLQAAMVELDKLRQEIASILQANAAADAAVAEGDVAAVMSANGWRSDTLKPALLARRAEVVAQHLESARKADNVQTLSAGRVVTVTEEGRQAFLSEHGIRQGSTAAGVDPRLLTAALVAGRGGRQLATPSAAPASGSGSLPIDERADGNGGALDLRKLDGRNPTERIITHLRATDKAFAGLSWQQQVGRAAQFRQENPHVVA